MKFFLLLFFIIIAISTQAQKETPVQWTTTFKDLGDKKLEITFEATIKEDFYVYSQFLESEDGLIPIRITFEVPGVTVLSNKETTSNRDNRIDEENPIHFKKDLRITLKVSYIKLPIKGHLEYFAGTKKRITAPDEINFAYYKYGENPNISNLFHFERSNILESLRTLSDSSTTLNPHNPLYEYLNVLEKSKQENKPLLLIFTSSHNPEALKMQKIFHAQNHIDNIIKKKYVAIYLYLDDRKKLPYPILDQYGFTLYTQGSFWEEFQLTNFQAQSQPYFVILNSKEEVLVTPIGYTKNAKDFENFLRSGINAYNKNH